LFTQILDFKRGLLAKLRNKRKSPRYLVGTAFHLKATLRLAGSDHFGRTTGGAGCEWSGRVANVSNNGLCVELPPAAAAVRGEKSEVRLTLEKHELRIPCAVAYIRLSNTHALCGLTLEFTDFAVQKAYLQLVEAVSMGASLAPFAPKVGGPNQSGLVREHYRADNKAMLTDWRKPGSGKLDSFELVLGKHRVKGGSHPPSLEVRKTGETAAVDAVVDNEVRQLLRWVAPNLPKSVPADLRKLIRSSADSAPAVAAPNFPPPPGQRPKSPADWLPPTTKDKA
jgi:hypothetical protein